MTEKDLPLNLYIFPKFLSKSLEGQFINKKKIMAVRQLFF